MDSLEFNKIAAAVLATLIIGLVASLIGDALVTPEALEQNVYLVQIDNADLGQPTHKAKEEKPLDPISPILAHADIEAGKRIAKKCIQCHTLDKGGPNKIGPNLWGIVNQKLGHLANFAYSNSLKEKGGTWTYEALNEFLAKPRKFITGTKMAFIGLVKEKERADLIAYIRTLSDSPAPLPKD